ELLHRSHGIGHGVSSVLVECHLPCQLTGIEDYSRLLRSVSGVLLMPLTWLLTSARLQAFVAESAAVVVELLHQCVQLPLLALVKDIEHRRLLFHLRSEERRVGKECRTRWAPQASVERRRR